MGNTVNNLNKTETTLVEIHSEPNPETGSTVITRRDFNSKKFKDIYGKYLKTIDFIPIPPEEWKECQIKIDEWVLYFYRNEPELIRLYEELDRWPPNVENDFPRTEEFREYWNTLGKYHQNKWCKYAVLGRPITKYRGLDLSYFEGYKVTSPFSHDHRFLKVLTLLGETRIIDLFIKEFRV